MKRCYILTLALAAALAVLAGCQRDPDDRARTEEQFKGMSVMGVYNESLAGVYLYDEVTAQYAVSVTHGSTRIQNDDNSKYVRIVMESAPTAGSTVKATVTRYGISGGEGATAESSLKVAKIEGGKIWLIDEKNTVCYLMPWGN